MTSDEPIRPRRDPRLRPANVRLPGATERAVPETNETTRPRPDPRTQRDALRRRPEAGNADPAQEQPAPRPRRDPRQDRRPRPSGEPIRAAVSAPDVLRVDSPNGHVMAVLDLDAGQLSRTDRELLGASRALADELGAALVTAACVTTEAVIRFDASSAGADRTMWLCDPAFSSETAAIRIEAIVAASETLQARHLVFCDSAAGAELGRRVAAKLGERAATNVIRLGAQNVVSLGDSGRNEYSRPTPRIVLLRPDTFEPISAVPRREARALPSPAFTAESELDDLGLLPVETASIPLAEADFIVSAGNGVSDWDSFHALAKAIGAAEGGSRVACDSGRLDRGRQIGASGTMVAPRCYIALGISGASQHLDGIVECPRVVAVNADAHADMMRRADLAVVGDVQQIMPALIRQVREAA